MANIGTCPKCDMRITKVTVEGVNVIGAGESYRGVSYLCPSCNCVLSVQIDPLGLNADLVQKLRKG
jgi:hypothetical protein